MSDGPSALTPQRLTNRPKMISPNLVDDALAYAAAGWRVFPCRPDKTPYTPNGFKDASVNPHRVREWWRQHPDAAIGAPTGEHFEVLHVDPRHGGDRNLAEIEAASGCRRDGRS